MRVARAPPALLPLLRRLPAPRDGDCLFWSIAEALNRSAPPILEAVTASVLARVAPDAAGRGVRWSGGLLRRVVAASVLSVDPVTDAALRESAAVAAGGSLAPRELAHFSAAARSGAPVLSRSWRGALAAAMRDRGTYWGDTYALYVLEALLQLRFIVLGGAAGGLRPIVTADHGADFAPLAFGVLELAADHYSPLLVTPSRSMLFARGDAPAALLAFLRATLPPGSPYVYLP